LTVKFTTSKKEFEDQTWTQIRSLKGDGLTEKLIRVWFWRTRNVWAQT